MSLFSKTTNFVETYIDNYKIMLQIKYIKSIVRDAADVPHVLNNAQVEFTPIAHANWSNEFPYCPDVQFRIAYNNLSLFLHYKVTEDSIRAKYGEDNGSVWLDSCVEFFCMPEEDDIYYNFECNCIGTILVGVGKDRDHRERANAETLGSIQRWSSLGRKTIEETQGPITWEVALIIPFSAFFKHRIRSLQGKQLKVNFYKCGDELQKPHFLSWNHIKLDKPNFHCPEFFGCVNFVSE